MGLAPLFFTIVAGPIIAGTIIAGIFQVFMRIGADVESAGSAVDMAEEIKGTVIFFTGDGKAGE